MGVGLEDGALAGGVLDGGVLEEGVLAGGVLDGFALEAGVLAAGGGDDRGFAILTSISTRGGWLDAGELMGFELEAGILEDAAGGIDMGELLAGELDAEALRLIVVFLNGGVGDMRMLLLLAGVVMGCELLIGVGVSLTGMLLAGPDDGALAGMLELRKGGVGLALGIALEAIFAFCETGAVPEDMAELAGAGAVELAKGGVLDGIRADEPPVDIGIDGLAFRAGVDMGDVEFMETIEEDFLADDGIGMDELELLAGVDSGAVEFIELMGAMEEGLAEEAPVDMGMAIVEFADEAILDEAPVERGRGIVVEAGVSIVEFENGAEFMGCFTEDVAFLGAAAAVLMLDLDMGAVALADDLDDKPWAMAPVESGGVMLVEDGLPAVEFMKGAALIFGGAETPVDMDIDTGVEASPPAGRATKLPGLVPFCVGGFGD